MRKATWLLLVALVLPGCGGGGGQSPLIGQWRVASLETEGATADCPGQLIVPGAEFPNAVCGPSDEFRFEPDGTYSHTYVWGVLTRDEGEYRQVNGTYTADLQRGGYDVNKDGRVAPDEVSGIGWADGPPTLTIVVLDANTLRFVVRPWGGSTSATRYDTIYVLRRLTQ